MMQCQQNKNMTESLQYNPEYEINGDKVDAETDKMVWCSGCLHFKDERDCVILDSGRVKCQDCVAKE